MTDLTNEVAVVTGGASGIGRAIALTFADHGADVVVADITSEPREGGVPTHDRIEAETDSSARYVDCDVREVADLEAAVDAAEAFGGVSVMVNNAGLTRVESFLDVTESAYDRLMEVNAKGAFFGSQVAAKRMVDGDGGAIVNMSSDAGLQGTTNSTVYGMSKGAVRTLTYSLAVQLGPSGVRANVIHPGPVRTALQSEDLGGMYDLDEHGERVPLGRVATPEDVARAALFLADPAASFVNGESLIVDGGAFRTP
ncbi:SDR family oxidoreductase [Halomarina oriensis]|uniref:Glucose 1-dehydrogenase n=1 Tax=Halomarina oriensis TaxID=671145 RepID=A0A6B0GFX1_9EURY|nr:SDR family oxidoreductase [Halomarina oriensis]MWG33410.1 glucose 1-dehydrogenase [Halomarina oriensis]